MIHHVCRVTMKDTATATQVEAALEGWREQGRSNPAIKSFVVGREHGGDYTYSAVFVVEDLDGLFAYLTHPTTYQTDHLGLNLVERMEIFDITDDEDPDLNDKIQELHRRRNELNPQVAGMLAEVPSYTGSGVDH
jgi:hypothetical protein